MQFVREIAKAIASYAPLRLIDTVANYAVMRADYTLLPAEFVISDRELYFAKVNELIGGSSVNLTFLEFGVFRGDSIRHWATLNTNPNSRLYGFDSFEGLPERWRGRAKGYFGLKGEVPAIHDHRVQLVKGLFSQTLPGVVGRILTSHPELTVLVHIDADLYSSALYCLTFLGSRLSIFYVMFDEYGAGEARALRDFLAAYGADFMPLLGLKRTRYSVLPTRVFGCINMPDVRTAYADGPRAARA